MTSVDTIIDYQVPHLGKLTAQLFPTSTIAFSLLENSKHIESMQNTPQLGVIRNVCQGAHHTRWEYVVTQLSLITHLNNVDSQSTGLSNDTPKIRSKKVSGADILQVWVLLLNMGHLFGTFSSERALLNQICKDLTLKRTFKSGLPNDTEIRDRFDKIVENEDVYRFHEIIAFFFLSRLKRNDGPSVELLLEILKYFRIVDPLNGVERIKRLRILFRRIRQVSYLFLDSQYGPVPVSFELGPILYNFEEHIKELFFMNESPLVRTLESFEELLTENFYLAAESMDAYGEHSRNLEKRIKSEKEMSSSILKLSAFLRDKNKLEVRYVNKKPELLRLLVDERRSPFPVTPSLKLLELEGMWNSKLPTTRCRCTFERDPRSSILCITLALNNNIRSIDKPRIFSLIMQRFIALQDKYSHPVGSQRMFMMRNLIMRRSFELSCKELLLFILRHLCGKEVNVLPVVHTRNPDSWLIDRGSTKTAKIIDRFATQFEIRNSDLNRLHEIKTLARVLEDINHRGTVLTTTSQILVRRVEDNSDITDLDGVAICSDASELSLLLVESKNTNSGGESSAESQLLSTLRSLGLDTCDYTITRMLGFGAYCKISLYKS